MGCGVSDLTLQDGLLDAEPLMPGLDEGEHGQGLMVAGEAAAAFGRLRG
jgi:hypothetical protein